MKTILFRSDNLNVTPFLPALTYALGATAVIADWNGTDDMADNTLAITIDSFYVPPGGVVFWVEDEAGLNNLVSVLRGHA